MPRLPIAAALLGAAAPVLAQANCSPGTPTALATRTPFGGNSLYGHPNFPSPPGPAYTGFNFLFDLEVTGQVDISRIDFDLYDAGGAVDLGNGTIVNIPNQVGNTTTVNFYIIPLGPWAGNELTQGLWGQLGSGTLTVGQPHADSICNFATPISIPSGTWAVCLEVLQVATGTNAGPLHPMLDPATPSPTQFVDSALRITNLQFQRESWTQTLASATHWQNLEFHYSLSPGSATWSRFGSGCGTTPPALSLQSRPLLGTTATLETSNIQSGTALDFWVLSFASNPSGLTLAPFGLPGCTLFLQAAPLVLQITGVSGTTSTLPLPIPNDPSYVGVTLFCQSAPATSGVNPGGFLVSNAVCMSLGNL